jgi:hypothetical protein
MDFKLDYSVGDIIWNNGPLTKTDVTQPFTENVQQRLFILLRTFQEEWFLDTTYGIPYFQRILGRKTPKSVADRIFQEKILEENGVAEILSYSSILDNRTYSAKFSVRCTNGEVASVEINNIGA